MSNFLPGTRHISHIIRTDHGERPFTQLDPDIQRDILQLLDPIIHLTTAPLPHIFEIEEKPERDSETGLHVARVITPYSRGGSSTKVTFDVRYPGSPPLKPAELESAITWKLVVRGKEVRAILSMSRSRALILDFYGRHEEFYDLLTRMMALVTYNASHEGLSLGELPGVLMPYIDRTRVKILKEKFVRCGGALGYRKNVIAWRKKLFSPE
jgi:hypothetical protein